MTDDILSTKLEIPTLGNIVVRRERLYDILGRPGDRRITLLIAPTGYGKTTALVEWLSARPKNRNHTAWITLDAFDNTPHQFWSYICAAFQKVYSRFSCRLNTIVPLEHDRLDIQRLVPLINAIALIPFRVNLVLDDYQSIDHEVIQQGIQYLMEHQPRNLNLILSSRIYPPFSFTRMQLQNRLVEIAIPELSFNINESETFLTGISGLNINPEQIKVLHKATEGWAAGLQLAALSLQKQPDFKYPVTSFIDENEKIFSFLTEEVLNQQAPEIQEFLVKTCILPDLSAPLCNAVLGRSDSKELLSRIEQANLFIVALDPIKGWYRYHPLFANAMEHHLRKVYPEIIPEIHRAASSWLYGNGYPGKAVSHALAVGDMDTAAVIANSCALQAVIKFDMKSLIHWTNRFSLDLISKYPGLGIYRALACFQLFNLGQVEPELQRVENAMANRKNEPLTHEEDILLHWEIEAMRAVMACLRGDTKHGNKTIHELQNNRPQKDNYFAGWMSHSLADIHLALGNLDSAEKLYDDGRRFAAAHDMAIAYIVSTYSLVQLYMQDARLQQAEENIQRGLDYAHRTHPGLWIIALLHSYWLEIDLECMKGLPRADRIQEIIRFYHDGGDDYASWGYQVSYHLSLARCFLSCHDTPQAAAYAGKAFEKINSEQDIDTGSLSSTRFLSELIDIYVKLWTATGTLNTKDESFMDEFPARGSSPLLDSAIQTALARINISQKEYQKALQILEKGESTISQIAMGRRFIEISILKAICHDACGDEKKAFYYLSRALDRAEPEGFLRIFIDEGKHFSELLQRYLAAGQRDGSKSIADRHQAYLANILGAFPRVQEQLVCDSKKQGKQPSILTPTQDSLTDREQDVYLLMSEGKTTKEIAAALHISIGTAKTHVWNIQRKLS